MEPVNILSDVSSRLAFRSWLEANHASEQECWVAVKRGRPSETDAGRAVLPAMGPRSFRVDPDLERALKDARCWSAFKKFPPLYQRVRAYNVAFYKGDQQAYERALANLIAHTKKGEMFGEWNDYGRLLDY